MVNACQVFFQVANVLDQLFLMDNLIWFGSWIVNNTCWTKKKADSSHFHGLSSPYPRLGEKRGCGIGTS